MHIKFQSALSGLSFRNTLLGVQFLFVAFGATVLVPLLVGIDPAVALFTAGVGTLIFHLITRGVVPVFLGSSFAFIAPIVKSTEMYGMPGTFGGIIAVGLLYGLMSLLVRVYGMKFIERLFPTVVIGPVIMVIGLSLAPVAVGMAQSDWTLALVSLLTAMLVVILGKGFLKLIPIMIGIIVGYGLAALMGVIDFGPVTAARWIVVPAFTTPVFSWGAILYLLPVAVAPLIEHIGDMYAIGNVANKNFIHSPGLHRTLLGDGVATLFAGWLGSVPNTTYSEVTGAISLTRVVNPFVLRMAAVTAIVFSLVGKISGLLKTIPQAVLGGIMLLLFGMIATIGLKTLVDKQVDLSVRRNQVIVAVVLTTGIGGAALSHGTFSLSGIGLASVAGVVLNLLFPGESTK
ncbi:MAG: NCS2 family nucleobase:cation symporter [Bacteroidales bacterium]|nr:NCS2 family nucleobase:cation symporter [Bacteroidales bacterium]MDD2323412.1 solute carrier family 23 protein [Bacteroidales bacterium]MDD3962306.1 solute carrier family 23 protein [Bacteroidales bacterium]MDY0286170.1 solute carrier family 23 protein [Bacteroidales bacterium]HPE87783.1 solute carrier family 23 protein [Bacteroidales bacterium]